MVDFVIASFVRDYTLVLDNDQSAYIMTQSIVRDVLRSTDVTLDRYLNTHGEERVYAWGDEIGRRILDELDQAFDEYMEKAGDGGLISMLIREVMTFSGDTLAREIGRHYLPETDSASDYLDADGVV